MSLYWKLFIKPRDDVYKHYGQNSKEVVDAGGKV